MHINTRIKKLEREAHAKTNKHTKIEIYIADWCDCKPNNSLPAKEYINGELIINVSANVEE